MAGTHEVYDAGFTPNASDDGHNNPGGLLNYDVSTGTSTIASYANEYDGRVALGNDLNSEFGTTEVQNIGMMYAATDSNQNTTSTSWTDAVLSYMTEYGYPNAQTTVPNVMDDNEFNVFLDAVTYAEGYTNMNNLGG